MKKMSIRKILFCLCITSALIGSVSAKDKLMVKLYEHPEDVPSLDLERRVGQNDSEYYELLLDQLKIQRNPYDRAQIYYLLANLYMDIEDMREAKEHARLAVAESKHHKGAVALYKKLRKTVDPEPTQLELFGQRLKKNNSKLKLNLGFEYANNVIQESVNPTAPTDKEDTAFVASLFYNYDWKPLFHGLSQNTSYNLSSYNYFDHKTLNLITHNLDHGFSGRKMFGENTLNHYTKLGLTYQVSESDSLFWDWNLSSLLYYHHKKTNIFWDGDISFSIKDYTKSSNDGLDGHNLSLGVAGMKFLDVKNTRSVRISLKDSIENADDNTQAYNDFKLAAEYQKKFSEKWLKAYGFNISFKWRNFDEASTGSSKRKDQQWKIGGHLDIPVCRTQMVTIALHTLENDSNINSSHYRNTQVSCTYKHKF